MNQDTGFLRLAIAVGALLFAPCCLAAEPAALDLHSILGSAYLCSVPGAIQFLTEDELVMLAGPNPQCYSADSLEIVAISLEGRVIARHPWASTEIGLVLHPGRLVLPQPGGVTILDEGLRPIQTVQCPRRNKTPEISATDTGILTLTVDGQPRFYFGTPLKEIRAPNDRPFSGAEEVISTGDGSWQLSHSGNSLVATQRGGQPTTIADLSWVNPLCTNRDLCPMDALHFRTVLGKRNRVLITSQGTKIPVTLSFGLVPYFRAQVFDLDSGADIFREEDFFRPRQRIAGLSPDGDRLVISDGLSALVHSLD